MATYDTSPVSLIAGADHSSNLYKFGKINSSGRVAICSVAGERADVVIGSKPTAPGAGMDGWIDRVVPIMCGGTVTAGDPLTTDANGEAVTASTGQYVNGVALEGGSSGAVIKMLRPLTSAVPSEGSSVSSSGAIPPTASKVFLTVSGTKAYTLANGSLGHEMEILCVSAASSPLGTVTIATVFGSEPTTHVFTTAGQSLRLVMTATGWKVTGKRRAGSLTVVVGTDVLTGYDLVETYNLSITDTVSSTSTKAIPDGLVIGEFIQVRCTTAGGTPAGSIDGTYKSLAAAATTHAAVNATADYFVAQWDGAAWLVTDSNSVSFS